jgi:hypothetical protein
MAVADTLEATIPAYHHQHAPSGNLADGAAELALSCVLDTA